MPVSERMREIEAEIDRKINALPVWQISRAEVVEQLMRMYRDMSEVVFLRYLHAQIFDDPAEELPGCFIQENRIRGGALWALKWALEFCSVTGVPGAISSKELENLIFLGGTYEAFVDILRCANQDMITLEIDEKKRAIHCYEGGNLTGFDVSIVNQGHVSTPITPHSILTENNDQLTSRWTAGDYRRVTRIIAEHAKRKEKMLEVDPAFLRMIGKSDIASPLPAVVWLERPSTPPDCYVFDDLVLPDDFRLKWKLTSLLETPIVLVGDRYCALSADVKLISLIDDYMLRLAARVDPQQYSSASLLREARMVKICEQVLGNCPQPWNVRNRVIYKNPPRHCGPRHLGKSTSETGTSLKESSR